LSSKLQVYNIPHTYFNEISSYTMIHCTEFNNNLKTIEALNEGDSGQHICENLDRYEFIVAKENDEGLSTRGS
jgi:hypothetical protein